MLVDFIDAMAGEVKVKDNRIVLRRDWPTEAERIKGAFSIARDLAERLAEEKKTTVKA